MRRLAVRAFNALGGLARRLGRDRPLDAEGILDDARRETGLEDFGSDDFLEPLALLAGEFEAAPLHPFGRACVRRFLVRHARNRLLLQAAWQRHPERLQQPLSRPLYVIGLPRTGTTLLYNLLCQDPRARPLMVWETMFPAASPAQERGAVPDRRRERARRFVRAVNWFVPELRHVHAVDPDGPEECGWLLNNSFVSPMFLLQAELPGYLRYLEDLSRERARTVYEHYRGQLQLLQAGDTARYWVLKSPAHEGRLAELLAAVPQARVIRTRRDPRQVVASMCSLVALTRGAFASRIDRAALGPEVARRLATASGRAAQAEADHPERMATVSFEDLTADPVGVVRHVYERFDLPWADGLEARLGRWHASHPRHRYGMHRYRLEDFGLAARDVERLFGERVGEPAGVGRGAPA